MTHTAPVAKIILTLCALAALNGCGFLPEDPRPKNHAMLPPFDIHNLLGRAGSPDGPVSVYDAIALGLQNNLEQRTASLKQEGAVIPASYSPAAPTPWATLDTGIDFARNQSSGSYDYQRKAASEIVQDVRYAWTRAASAALLKNDIETAIAASKAYLAHTPDADLEREVATLESLQQQLNSAPAELASLTSPIAKPLDTNAFDKIEKDPVPSLTTSIDELEIAALLTRPELRDSLAEEPMSVEEIRSAVLKTFPNIRAILGRAAAPGQTINQTIDPARWENFSTTFTQSLIRIFTLPLQLQDDQNRRLLASLRQQAMSAAILAQVHLAYSHYREAQQKFAAYRTILDRVDAVPPVTDETAALRLSLTRITARARLHLAHAELLTATARLMEAVGLDLLPQDVQGMTPQMMAGEVRKRLKSADYSLLDALVARIDQHKAPVPPGENHAILAEEKLTNTPEAGIEPAVYRQDQGVTLWQASLSRPVVLIPSRHIPPAQKVSAQAAPPGLAQAVASGESETLRMPDKQTQALLNAPVSNDP